MLDDAPQKPEQKPEQPQPRVSNAAWDRWQNIRTPETVDEAVAAIRIASVKASALGRLAGEVQEATPDRATHLRSSADHWRSHVAGLEWCLEVLRAGESPLHARLDELRERYNRLLRTVAFCPDSVSLLALLQRQLAANDRAREHLSMEVMGLESLLSEERAEHARVLKVNSMLREKIAELRAKGEVTRG